MTKYFVEPTIFVFSVRKIEQQHTNMINALQNNKEHRLIL